MKCIYCDAGDSKVLDSRYVKDNNAIRRRRECIVCGKRWTTYETADLSTILVEKKNKNLQPFDKQKIVNGLIKACEKRPVGLDEIEYIANEIEKNIKTEGIKQIASIEIGEEVLDKLKAIDEISYIRFALVLYNFDTVQELKEFIDF